MAYFSVLDLEKPEAESASRAGFFWDLNLNQIIDMIQQQSPQYDISKMYYRFPLDEACVEYRKKIYEDIKQTEIYECLRAFSEGMRRAAVAESYRETVKTELQRNAWHVNGAYEYCTAVNGLQAALSGIQLQSEGLRRLSEYLDNYTVQEAFQKCRGEAESIQRTLENLHLILEIEDNRIVITQGKQNCSYEKKLGYGEDAKKLTPFLHVPGMSPLEVAIFDTFRRKNPEFFDRVEDFSERFPSYEDTTILQLEQEIQYYLAFWRFEEKMKEHGFDFCAPDKDGNREMEAERLYDLALACANCTRGRFVVSNNFVYREGERFFVVGGPNQGGKTTFARSLGQLVYFAGMGLDVPAARANVPYFAALLTHFSAEESLGSGKGKLKEELIRLVPMMKEQAEGAFVIINELFTTAAHYDGCIMGKRVLTHFIKNGCMGIYVTHLRELGNSIEGVTALTAMLDGSKERKRTYKISREKMGSVGYAEDIVNKYGLTYQELHQRLMRDKEGWQ